MTPPGLRRVTSFVRRSTRMNATQATAWERYHDQFVIEPPLGDTDTSIADDARCDWAAIFGRSAPTIVEIGSGAGEALAVMASGRPDADVVAFEVYLPAVASTLSRLVRHEVTNARVVTRDGTEGLRTLFEPASVMELRMFFPDPWHKTRHHKRRLVSPGFADLAASRLATGALWRIATDWADYADHTREVLDGHRCFELASTDRGDRPVTRFEQRGVDAGRDIVDLVYRRLPCASN